VKRPFVILKPFSNVVWERQEFSHLAEVRNPHVRSEEEFVGEIEDAHLLIADVDIKVTQTVLAAATQLRAVVCASTGVDFVDVPAATRGGILVTNLPDYCVEAVAEHALALLLCLSRQIVPGVNAVREGNWEKRRDFQGIELEGKALGIVGLGRIGRRVAERAQALGMRILFYDPLVSGESVRNKGYEKQEGLLDLIQAADMISVHAALMTETIRMFGEAEFRHMKPSAYFINVARGGIVDEGALFRALSERWIAGAALDVLTEEPPAWDHPLLKLDNLIITPHLAYNTREAKEKARAQLKEVISSVIHGHYPINVINPELKGRWNYA